MKCDGGIVVTVIIRAFLQILNDLFYKVMSILEFSYSEFLLSRSQLLLLCELGELFNSMEDGFVRVFYCTDHNICVLYVSNNIMSQTLNIQEHFQNSWKNEIKRYVYFNIKTLKYHAVFL